MIKFMCDGNVGYIDRFNYILYCGCGFHLEDIPIDSPVRIAAQRAINKYR